MEWRGGNRGEIGSLKISFCGRAFNFATVANNGMSILKRKPEQCLKWSGMLKSGKCGAIFPPPFCTGELVGIASGKRETTRRIPCLMNVNSPKEVRCILVTI